MRFGLCGAVGAVSLTAAPALAVNLLLNPSFEAPSAIGNTSDVITGWTRVLNASRATFRPGNTGSWSVWAKTFEPVGGGWFQNVVVTPGEIYDFSAFASYEAGFLTITDPVGADMRVTWRDSGGGQVGAQQFVNITPADNPTTSPSDAPVWIQYTLNDLVAPAGATQARIFVGWTDGGPGTGAQSMFWDDVVFDGPGVAPGNTWAVNGSGDWNVAGNWALGSVPNGADGTAEFLDIITSNATVFTNTPVTVGELSMGNANTYVLTGAGSLTMQAAGGAQINVTQGLQKINLPLHLASNTTANVSAGATLNIADPLILNGNSLTKTGPGTLLIEAPVRSTASGTLRVSGGTANINFGIGTPATGAAAAQGNVSLVVDGSVARLGADQTLGGLDAVTANAGDQEIDLLGNRARVYSANLANTELGIYNDIRAARTSGSGRDGIYSSVDDAGTNFSVGVTDQARDAHNDLHVLARLTRTGDANVDGTTDIGDFALLAANFNATGRWDNGDFDYNGVTDIGDFALLAANFNQSASDLPRGTAVPEPATIGLMCLSMGLVARRRR